MKMRQLSVFAVCFTLVACVTLLSGVADDANASVGLPPGTYGGCGQKMVIGHDGSVSYKDKLHLAGITIRPDGGLDASFPTDAGWTDDIHLQSADPENRRAVWTASAGGRNYKATATNHSEETYSFRLEVRRDGKLVAGSQVFCAICKSRVQNSRQNAQ